MFPFSAFGASGGSAQQSPVPTQASDSGDVPVGGEDLLLAIARHRDRDAFRHLFNDYAPRIKRFVCARGLADALAEEVVQDVMLKVWRKASLYDPGRAGASTWIHSIARNCLLDRVRGEQRPEVEDDDPTRVPAAAPDEDLALAEGRLALTRAMKALPSGESDVLRAGYFEGLSMREIAERQGLPLGTVKSRTRNALARLRSLLGRCAP